MEDRRLYPHYIGDFMNGTHNNFNLIRLLCAWGVLVFHSRPLAHGQASFNDYILQYLHISMGEFCVLVFFSISGFLIYRSMCRTSSLLSYVMARLLRLLPALIVVLLVTVLVLGPLATTLDASEYFSNPGTWSYFYNLNLLDTATQYTLPGVFTDNPYANGVNGSLWTLPLETRLYVATLVFFYGALLLTKLSGRLKPIVTLLALMGIAVWGYLSTLEHLLHGHRHALSIVLFNSAFFMGGLLFSYRHRVPLKVSWAIILLLGTQFLDETTIYPLYGTFAVVYTVLVVAYIPKGKLLLFNKLGDYSYGMYIYAFPVQQSLSHWTEVGFVGMVCWSTVITLGLSVLSWHLLESPALGLKNTLVHRLRTPRAPKATTAA